MRRLPQWVRAGLAAAVLLAFPLAAQDYGDTPYVQTPKNVVEKMLEVAKVGPADYVIDLGSGDGRMVIMAAKERGARGFGVDLDRKLVALANRNAKAAGVAGRAQFFERNLYETDLRPASVLTIYLLPEVNMMVRPKLFKELKPGTRVVTHDYDMGDWPPDLALVMDAPDKPVGRDKKSKVFLYIVPGNAAGSWMWRVGSGVDATDWRAEFKQNFQKLTGSVVRGGVPLKLQEATLTGEQVRWVAADDGGGRWTFDGKLYGNAIEGTMTAPGGDQRPWQATRTALGEPAHINAPVILPPQIPQ